MIGKLSGIIDSIEEKHVLLDVGGVGYIVHASSRTLSRIGQVGDTLSILIETQVREDAITLFGFADAAEQAWFKLLTSVQGVGAKVGLAILTVCPPETLAVAIAAQDKDPIRQADGVGPKLAVRIITELKDKAGNIDLGTSLSANAASTGSAANITDANPADNSVSNDAISALMNLGYARSDAYTAVLNAINGSDADERDNVSIIIRLALKALSG